MSALIVALLSFAGTAIGTLAGILSSAKLTSYRIAQLEDKVDRHNKFAERIPVINEQIKVINHRLEDLEVSI